MTDGLAQPSECVGKRIRKKKKEGDLLSAQGRIPRLVDEGGKEEGGRERRKGIRLGI